MKFKYYFWLSSKIFFRKKINYLSILLLSICSVLIIISLSFLKTLVTYIENETSGNISHHILVVNSMNNNYNFENLDDYIEYVSDFKSYSRYVSTEDNEVIRLIGLPDSFLKKISNKFTEKEMEKNLLICPSKFYLGEISEDYDENFLNKIHDGQDFIDKKISLNSKGYKKVYKIIDTYDVTKFSYGEYNICFTFESNIKDIYESEANELLKQCQAKHDNCEKISLPDSKIVFVKDINDIDYVTKMLENNDMLARKMVNVSTKQIKLFTKIVLSIACIILLTSFSIIVISNNKFIQYNKKNNLIYKVIGYDNRTLIKLNYCESFTLATSSIILSTIMLIIIYLLLNKTFAISIAMGMNIYISLIGIIISLLILFITPFFSFYVALKNNNNSIIEELSDGEI